MLLALDTVFSACSVALADKTGTILAARHLEQSRGQAETLVPMAQEVLREAAIQPNQITQIAVTAGPGTFAGVRIGVAFARTLALPTGAEVLGISSFEALAGAVILDKANSRNLNILAVMPGKRGEVSVTLFAGLGGGSFPPDVLKAPENIPLEDLKTWVGKTQGIVIGPNAADLEGLSGFDVIAQWITAEQLVKIAQLFPKNSFQATVSPFYLRAPDAKPQKSPFSRV